jgi:hypothetical protein
MEKVILNESEYKKVATRATELASNLLDGDDHYLDNILEISQAGYELVDDLFDTEFHIFAVIISETDHLPTNKVRPLCSESMLKRSDAELVTIIKHYKADVANACHKILSKYKNV